MIVAIGDYVLCDGTLSGGVAISALRVDNRHVFDEVIPIDVLPPMTPADVISPVIFDRTCAIANITFLVKRVHADLNAAETFILELDVNIPEGVNIVTFTTSEPSSSTVTIPNGVVTNHSLQEQSGSTTIHQYTVAGGAPAFV